MSEPIQEFLIPIKFKTDAASEAKMRESMRGAMIQANLLADAIEGALKSFGQVMQKVAANLDELYFSSQRMRASAENIRSFEYAARQLGAGVGEAGSALESFAKFMRSNPGAENWLKKLGIKTDGKDNAQLLQEFGQRIAQMPRFLQQQYAGLVGISDKMLFALTDPKFGILAEEQGKLFRRWGMDVEGAKDKSNEFWESLRRAQMVLSTIAIKIEGALIDKIGGAFRGLGDFLERHGQEISETVVKIAEAGGKVASEFFKAVTGTDDLDKGFSKILKTIRGLSDGIKDLVDQIVGLVNTVNKFGESTGITWLLNRFGYYGPPNENPGTGPSGGGGGVTPRGGLRSGADNRTWWERHAPKILGGKDAPGEAGGGTAPAPGAPGKYRPVYKLTDRDLSDAVVNTIAGEASYKRPGAVDAVINNMMNRVGSKGWGPSSDLHAVARAPGQYAGYKRASAEEAAYIRDRIRAIASGGVPDNTNGSNAYRASFYNGPWMRKWGINGVNVGGNVFAYEPNVKNGPYAAYKTPREDGGGGFIGSAYAAPSQRLRPDNPYGGLPEAGMFQRPLDGGINQSWNRQTTNNMSFKTDIKVDGAADPEATAALIGSRIDGSHRTFARTIRNFQGAAQ